MFIVTLLFMLVAVDYIYSISDIIVNSIYGKIIKNQWTDNGFQFYEKMRAIMYGGITGVLVPFLIFLSFASSFINRNQDIISYMITSLVTVLFTPIAIYIFTELVTQLLNVSILNTSYMATVYFSNFIYIMVANMLLTLASFVFIAKKQAGIM